MAFTLYQIIKEVLFPLGESFAYQAYHSEKLQAFAIQIGKEQSFSYKTNRHCLRGLLSEYLYRIISADFDEESPGAQDNYTDRKLSAFVRGIRNAQSTAPHELIALGKGENLGWMIDEYERVRDFVRTSAIAKGLQGEEAESFFSARLAKSLENSLAGEIRERLGTGKEITGDNASLFLACAILFALFDADWYMPKYLQEADKGAIEEHIRDFFRMQIQSKSGGCATDVYCKKIFEHLSSHRLRDMQVEKRVLSRVYIQPRFKNLSDYTPAPSPVSGDRFRRMMLGDSGLGKTMFSEMIALVMATEDYDTAEGLTSQELTSLKEFARHQKKAFGAAKQTPVLLYASELNSVAFSKKDPVKKLLLEHALLLQEDEAAKEEILKNPDVLLIVDGLDELAPEKRKLLCTMLSSFAKIEKDWSLLLTCRNISLPPMSEFELWEIQDLDKEHMEKLIDNITDAYVMFDAGKAQWFKEVIHENEHLAQIAKNPFLLIKVIVALNGKQPGDKIRVDKVYETITRDLILCRMTEADSLGYNLSGRQNEIERALRSVAWALLGNGVCYETGKFSIPEGAVRDIILKSMEDGVFDISREETEAFVAFLSYNSGLLIYRDSEYSFLHQVFLLYYAAKHLEDALKALAEHNKIRSDAKGLTGGKFVAEVSAILGELESKLTEDAVANMLMMTFARLSPAMPAVTYLLFDYLLYKSAAALSEAELESIAGIFRALLAESFGPHRLTDEDNRARMERVITSASRKKEA